MTVPAAIRELEKIEIVRHIDHEYSMDYAVTATQKSILKAFDLAETNIRKQAAGINDDLKSGNTKEAYQWHAENSVSMTRSISRS